VCASRVGLCGTTGCIVDRESCTLGETPACSGCQDGVLRDCECGASGEWQCVESSTSCDVPCDGQLCAADEYCLWLDTGCGDGSCEFSFVGECVPLPDECAGTATCDCIGFHCDSGCEDAARGPECSRGFP
jgi:hypothetical protein